MRLLNRDLAKSGVLGKLEAMSIPNCYYASSIADFFNHRNEIELSGILKSFFTHLRYLNGPMSYRESSVIFLENLIYEGGMMEHTLGDLTGAIDLPFFNLLDGEEMIEQQAINIGDKIQRVGLLYYPCYDAGAIAYLQKLVDIRANDCEQQSLWDIFVLTPQYGV